MTDTTNTEPPLPEYPVKGLRDWYTTEWNAILAYGDARAAHAVAQLQGEPVDIVATLQEIKATASKRHPLHAATAPAPVAQAREITDAEIDSLLFDAIGFELETEQWMNRSDLHRIVRAAIALAKGRGLP